MAMAKKLVVVCCHGIWVGGPKNGFDESEWLIADFQKGETSTFIEHLKAGLRELRQDEGAILMISGGPTRKETRLSEAESYANIAAANDYFGIFADRSIPKDRIMVESRALDSYYNIIFSLLHFWRTQHRTWPARLTIVSHAFKRARVVDAHCAAIGFPLDRVAFVGIDPPAMHAALAGSGSGGSGKQDAVRGVGATADLWLLDPHGVGEVLAGKRRRRNPWLVDQSLFLSPDEAGASGLATRRLDGVGEVLVEDAPRPWA